MTIKNIKNKKILLDVDTGIDDALAIIFLSFYLKAQIIGITTCGGNVEVEQTTENTLAVLSLLNLNIPVYPGSDKPLNKKSYTYAKYFHGQNGLADIKLPIKHKAQTTSAVDFIIQAINKYQKDLIIVSTAPATNLAKAIIKKPDLADKINQLYIMGGAVDVPGNETEYAETNFFQDPEAIQIIFNQVKDITIIPLDVTNQCPITKSAIQKINRDSPVGKFTAEAITNWYNFFGDPKDRQFELYDPLAVSVLTKPFMKFKTITANIDATKNPGQIIKGKRKINYAYSVKGKEFVEFFISTINNY